MEWQYRDILFEHCTVRQVSNELLCKTSKDGHCSYVLHPSSCIIRFTLACLSKLLTVQRMALRWICSIWFIRLSVCGSHTAEAYSSCDLTRVLYAVSRTLDIFVLILRRLKPRVRFAFPVMRSTWEFQERSLEIRINPKIFGTGDRLEDLSMQ